MRERRRDFFLENGVRTSDHEMMAAMRQVADVRRDCPDEHVRGVACQLVYDEAFRHKFFMQVRQAAWYLRNYRYTGAQAHQDYVTAKEIFAMSMQLLEIAGMPLSSIRGLVQCLTHDCTCDGCDLSNGYRFDKIAAELASENPRVSSQDTGGMADVIES